MKYQLVAVSTSGLLSIPSTLITANCLLTLSCVTYSMEFALAGSWTWWSPENPSNSYDPVILWFCESVDFFVPKISGRKLSSFQTLVMYTLQVKRLICMLNLIMWIDLFSMCMCVCRMKAQKSNLSLSRIRKGFTNYFRRCRIMTLHMNENWWFRDMIVFRATVLYTANLSNSPGSVTKSQYSPS